MPKVTYTPKWSDGKPLETLTITLVELDHKDGWLIGKTPEGSRVGPIPDAWVSKIDT